jgi:hypothetical protein
VSAPHSDLITVVAPGTTAKPTRRERVRGALRQYFDDLFADRAGIEPVERGAFRRILLLWLVARALNFALLWGFYEISRAGRWVFGPDGGYATSFLHFLTEWDAARYLQIAEDWYPTSLPMNLSGDVLPNNWAFLPVFPMMERFLATVTGMPMALAGVIISTAASLGATWVLYLIMRRSAPPQAAWWAIVFFSFAPLSFVFVLGYAESLFLLLTFLGLLFAMQRRYWLILPVGLTLAFTRPGALALALALGIVFVARFLRRGVDPFPARQWVALFTSGMLTALAGLSWTQIANHVTGTRNAYIRTETGWWLGSVGNDEFIPLTPWFRQAGTHLGVFGIILVIALMVGFAALIWSKSVRRLGFVVVAYAFSYGLYLFAVFLPQNSTFRLMMPLSPLLADDRFSSRPRVRRGILVGCLVLQVVSVWLLWTTNHP